eukprot:71354-Rhodomonas_salina.2
MDWFSQIGTPRSKSWVGCVSSRTAAAHPAPHAQASSSSEDSPVHRCPSIPTLILRQTHLQVLRQTHLQEHMHRPRVRAEELAHARLPCIPDLIAREVQPHKPRARAEQLRHARRPFIPNLILLQVQILQLGARAKRLRHAPRPCSPNPIPP